VIKKTKLPISIVIPTLGQNHLIKCLEKINLSICLPSEVLIVVPNKNYSKNLFLKSIFPKLTIQIISSKKKNQVYQRILGFKKAKYTYVMQLDDDVELDKNCLYDLYYFIKGKKKVSVAPRYTEKNNPSAIYKKPKNFFLKFYHWLINSSKGFSPGNISLSGFNYLQENKVMGYAVHEWLSGGAVIHYKKNLILNNYYPYNFYKSFCEDILHSLILRKKNIKLIKFFGAKVSARQSGKIADNSNKIKVFKDFYYEFLIRSYIVKKFKLSILRLIIYYLIYLTRILIRMFK